MLTIKQIKDVITDYFKDKPVDKVFLFGSYARGDAREDSDIDILFSLNENSGISYFNLAKYLVDLEEKLSAKIDLVNDGSLYPRLRKFVDEDKILMFSKSVQ